MKRFAFAVLALAALSIPASADSVSCAKDYKGFWDGLNKGPAKDLTAEQHAMVSRQALRAFDSCTAGDEAGSKSIFTRLQEAAPAKGADYWQSLNQSAPAKK